MTNETRFYLNRDSLTDVWNEKADFDARDAKGRMIGCVIERQIGTFTDAPARQYEGFFHDMWLGTVFTARVSATRDGWRFGALQSRSYFRTEAEADAFVAKRVAASRKAAAKKVA